MGNPKILMGLNKSDNCPEFSEDFLKEFMQIGKELTELELCKV